MLRFLTRGPRLGLEITSSEVRLAALSGSGTNSSALSLETAELPAGTVNEDYASPNITDPDGLAAVVRSCLERVAHRKTPRTALSLPDSVFRVQTLELDELPGKAADRERLIRWRLEKAAAFDTADTVLRYHVLRRQEKGFTVLSCIAKREVLAQYETLITDLGLEPWTVGLSSFHTVNFYLPYISKKSAGFALASIGKNFFTTIVMERGGPRFYRFKEIKPGSPGDVKGRIMRELEDSLHFYMHMDRSQPSEVGHLYLAGDAALLDALAQGLMETTSLEIEALSPAAVLPLYGTTGETTDRPGTMAAALGAGGML